MRLAGDLAEFSLPDLIQIKSAARQTDGLRILGPDGNGLILLRDGEVIHAEYEDLAGERAFLALVGVRAGYFEAAAVPVGAVRSIHKPVRELLMDAHQLAEQDRLPRPSRRATPSGVTGPGDAAHAAGASARPRVGVWALGVALALLLGVGAAMLLQAKPMPAVAVAPAARSSGAPAPELTVEADELSGPGDRKPALRVGERPLRPNDDVAVVPTIVVRLRIDSRGEVAEAKVYRSRVELADFEATALLAVESYRFDPAARDGVPVGVWINWPVDFR